MITFDDPRGEDRSRVGLALMLLGAYVLFDLGLRSVALRNVGVIPWYPGAGVALILLVVGGPRWALALLLALELPRVEVSGDDRAAHARKNKRT